LTEYEKGDPLPPLNFVLNVSRQGGGNQLASVDDTLHTTEENSEIDAIVLGYGLEKKT